MKFECGDLERALSSPELMPEAREHLKVCSDCRREYRVWNEISNLGRELHQEWESPELWTRIRDGIEAQQKEASQKSWHRDWRAWSMAAAILVLLGGATLWKANRHPGVLAPAQGTQASQSQNGGRDFLTEQALAEVQRTEAAYRQSIKKLSELAEPELAHPKTAAAVNDREKIQLLDSAILDTRSNLDHNRFNLRLQTELAELYREKQQTLQELLTRDRKN
jgi:hypothetical protein